MTRMTVTHLTAEQLSAHPDNVRQDLGDLIELGLSIRELGILEPLQVTEHPTRPGVFVILDGHRRFGAGQLAHLAAYPVIIRHDVDDPVEQTITMLATDVHKRAFKPMERANAYGALRNRGLTGAEIARRVGVSTATVAAYLNLLHLDGQTAEKVDAGELPVTKAVEAVVEQRVAARMPIRGRPKMVSYFSQGHRLASVVRRSCTHRRVTQVGSVGCGPCWEQAIREEDEAAARSAREAAAAAAAAQESIDRGAVDPVLVQRFLNGEHHLVETATAADRHEITDAWLYSGRSWNELERVTGWNHGRYGRTRPDAAPNTLPEDREQAS